MAVITAIFMVVMLGMAAIVVDVGMIYAERFQLQNGADAAALAIAQDCAAKRCTNPEATATALAGKNAHDGVSAATAVISGRSVTVRTSTATPDGGSAVRHWFAPVLGIESTEVEAVAKASWGSPSKATVFPFTAPRCMFDSAPTDVELWITSTSTCTGSGGKTLPGAFGWLDEDVKNSCRTSVDVDQVIGGDPGKSGPKDCHIDGTTILLPVYASASGNGNHVSYVMDGFAAFKVSAHSWPSEKRSEPGCSNCTGIKGKFITLVSLADLQSFGVEELDGKPLNAFFVALSL
ncbi:hypothetical protein BJG92_00478 [Arthrobacter sp. SO5]|uniref:Tad domain-containing protein n=1 Tax=Arthrobacter sp. SO5 TaxID=1897055 RepID=UPI001E4D7CAD|nr:Tad domain-containing protein [Arthrobacter sp. SO5]MCB5272966.1 hypothetical protein [Arthrobacter sp. SO5]